MNDDPEKQITEATNLANYIQSEGGMLLMNLIKDTVIMHMNRIGTCTDNLEVTRLSGGIRFGEELLNRIYGKINMGKLRKERQAEGANLQIKRNEQRRIPTANYERSAI